VSVSCQLSFVGHLILLKKLNLVEFSSKASSSNCVQSGTATSHTRVTFDLILRNYRWCNILMYRLSLSSLVIFKSPFCGHIQATPLRNPKISLISSFSSSLHHFRSFRIRNFLYRLRSHSKYISGISEKQQLSEKIVVVITRFAASVCSTRYV
jgi:hypothetical protein